MTSNQEKLERQVELVKKYYPDSDSIWAFFNTLPNNDFVLNCMKNNFIDKKVKEYLGEKHVTCDEWVYTWEVFAMIEYASACGRIGGEIDKYLEFEKQFQNI